MGDQGWQGTRCVGVTPACGSSSGEQVVIVSIILKGLRTSATILNPHLCHCAILPILLSSTIAQIHVEYLLVLDAASIRHWGSRSLRDARAVVCSRAVCVCCSKASIGGESRGAGNPTCSQAVHSGAWLGPASGQSCRQGGRRPWSPLFWCS